MPTPADQRLYDQAKERINRQYTKPSAYRSGATVKLYKQLFADKYGDDTAPYQPDGRTRNLARWFHEDWIDVNSRIGVKDPNAYPLYRPTKRISAATPLTLGEIPVSVLRKQSRLKQVIRGTANLPPFASWER